MADKITDTLTRKPDGGYLLTLKGAPHRQADLKAVAYTLISQAKRMENGEHSCLWTHEDQRLILTTAADEQFHVTPAGTKRRFRRHAGQHFESVDAFLNAYTTPDQPAPPPPPATNQEPRPNTTNTPPTPPARKAVKPFTTEDVLAALSAPRPPQPGHNKQPAPPAPQTPRDIVSELTEAIEAGKCEQLLARIATQVAKDLTPIIIRVINAREESLTNDR